MQTNTMKNKIAPVFENVAESTAACLITMAQGNILAMTVSHWVIASQTGVVAGAIASAAIFAARTDNRRVISILLGIVTAVVDFMTHPGNFGPVAMEAIVTGIGAAALSYVVGSVFRIYRARQPVTQ